MKKILTLLLLALLLPLRGQNVLSSQSLDLKRSSSYFRSLLASEANEMQLAAFVSDKEKLTAFRYNGAAFFTDSLSVPRPDQKYVAMAGYSYTNSMPTVYWTSQDMKEIAALTFDFKGRTVANRTFTLPFEEDESVLLSYSENDNFYLLTLPSASDKDILRMYVLSDGKYEVHDIDFSAFTFTSESGKKTTLAKLLKNEGLRKIDSRGMTDPFTASAKIKLYSLHNSLLLTLDNTADATYIYVIDVMNYSVSPKKVPQVQLAEAGNANSFYHEGKLYQLKFNDEELALSATSYASGELVKTYRVTKNDSIAFKNSPLLSQTGDSGVRELKDTKRFLRRLSGADPSVTVYRTPDDILVTAGGVRSVVSTGNIIAGVTLGVASAAMGGYGYAGGLLDGEELQTVCFESLFDDEFNHNPYQQMRLAADYMAQFTAQSGSPELVNVVPFRDYYIMGYYDAGAKKYVLRSFYDDRAQ